MYHFRIRYALKPITNSHDDYGLADPVVVLPPNPTPVAQEKKPHNNIDLHFSAAVSKAASILESADSRVPSTRPDAQ